MGLNYMLTHLGEGEGPACEDGTPMVQACSAGGSEAMQHACQVLVQYPHSATGRCSGGMLPFLTACLQTKTC